MNNLGNERELGAQSPRPGRAEGRARVLLAGSGRVCGPAAPGRWKPLPVLPAGLTLAPGTARSAAFLTFRGRSGPRRPGPAARPCFGKPWGLGASETRDGTPKPGARPDSDVRFRLDPLAGSLPLWKARRSLAHSRAGLALPSAQPGASTQYVSQQHPACFPAVRKSSSASATGRLKLCPLVRPKIMLILITKPNRASHPVQARSL